MSHFPPGDWIDRAQGVLPATEDASLQLHLDDGCEECLKALETWRRVVQFSRREAGYRPPESAVRAVKAAFVGQQRPQWSLTVTEFARLLFDSFAQPATAMVRSPMRSSRQLLYESDPFTVDLRLESDPLRKHTSITGQILNSQSPEQSTSAIDVVLLSGERLIRRAKANAEGEFEIDFGAESDVQLFIDISGKRAIGIDLAAVDGGKRL